MEPTERAKAEEILEEAIQARKKFMAKWDGIIQEMRDALTPDCPHTKTRTYQWEHDTGYGKQIPCIGEECVVCLKRNPYPTLGRTSRAWT